VFATPFLFIPAIYWIMREVHVTHGKKYGIRWTLMEQLEDIDFEDDLVLLSHSYVQMQDNIPTSLRINKNKAKVMRVNSTKF